MTAVRMRTAMSRRTFGARWGARAGRAALVGSPDQVLSKLEDYREMGIRAFIL